MVSRKTLENEYNKSDSVEIQRLNKKNHDSGENKPRNDAIPESLPVKPVKPVSKPAEGPNYQKQIFQKAMQNIKSSSKHEPPKKPASAYIIF